MHTRLVTSLATFGLLALACGGSGSDGADAAGPDASRTDARAVDAAGPDAPLFGLLLADSVRDFAGVQGASGWSYGYHDATADALGDGVYQAADFIPMPTFLEGAALWVVLEGELGFWTVMNAGAAHPNGEDTTSNRQPVEHWPTRRWTSTYAGTVRADTTLALATALGDGVELKVFVDGTPRGSVTTLTTDPVATPFCLPVSVGAHVDFALTPGPASNDGSDTTDTTFTVTAVDPASCP